MGSGKGKARRALRSVPSQTPEPTHWLTPNAKIEPIPQGVNIDELRWAVLPADMDGGWGGILSVLADRQTAEEKASKDDRGVVPVAPDVDAQKIEEDELQRYEEYMKPSGTPAPEGANSFVYGCCTPASSGDSLDDQLSGAGSHWLIISLKDDWANEQRMSDYYSDSQYKAIEDAFKSCGVPAFEATESTYELDGMSSDEAREALRSAPGFTYDAAFEKAMSW